MLGERQETYTHAKWGRLSIRRCPRCNSRHCEAGWLSDVRAAPNNRRRRGPIVTTTMTNCPAHLHGVQYVRQHTEIS